jgi:cobalt-zinc-cadmium efflux system outer membrane protein
VSHTEPSSIADEEIAQLEHRAFANNPALAQARDVVDAALGRLVQAGLYPNPTLGYVASEVGNDGRAGQHGFVIAQEFVRGGKLVLSQAVAGYARDQAEAQLAIQVWRLRNAVRSLYFETLAAQETMKLSDELVALAEQGVLVAQQREKAGEGTLTETLQAQIELAQVQMVADNSRNSLRAAWKRLAAVIGDPVQEPETLHGELAVARVARDEAQSLAQLTGESPEVHTAQAGIRRADAVVARARAEPTPNVTIEAGPQYDYSSNTTIASVGISIPLPIWNRNEGNIYAAEAERRRSQREVDRVKLSLAERFAVTYGRYRTAQQQAERFGQPLSDDEVKRILSLMGDDRQRELERSSQILPRAQIALALATEGWRRGEFGYLQVLTAQRTLAQARLGQVRAQSALRKNAVALDGYLLTDGLGDPEGGQPFGNDE